MIINKNTTILAQLKEATKEQHDATEAVALSDKIKDNTLSLAEYKQLLFCNWQIHTYLTHSFSVFLDTHPIPSLHSFVDNRKTEWLQADLISLNVPLKQSFVSPKNLPTYNGKAALIGGLYVAEGSMLGGQYISRQLRTNHHLTPITTFRFYEGYGKETGKRWAAFRKLIKTEIQTAEDASIAIQSAKTTFVFFETCYKENLLIDC